MKSALKLFLSMLAVFIFSAAASAQDFRAVDTKEMKTLVAGKKKVVIIDARTPEEYAAGHIPAAINVSYEKFPKIDQYLPKDRNLPLIFYCRGYT
jgi:phage shock protein E